MSIEDIKLVKIEDMKITRGGCGIKNKGKMYTKYATALKSVIPFLKDEIEKGENIRVKSKDIIKKMGREFEMRDSTTLLWGIKYVLFKEGIFLSTGRHQDGDDIYVLRKVSIYDKLPGTLSEKLEKEKEKTKKETEKETEKEV